MLKSLKVILEIQELDIKMIRLMRLKRDRQKELAHIKSIKEDLKKQVLFKESELVDLRKGVRLFENEIGDIGARLKKLESQQNSIKKIDEFNALTQEISAAEREKSAKEQRLGDLMDKVAAEEDLLKNLQDTMTATEQNSRLVETEIQESIVNINREGKSLLQEKEELVAEADAEILSVYDRLLRNKRDRVIVPIESRACSGCHIVVTAQHENLVRKGERLVFCEHCSRIHYWQDSEIFEVSERQATRRRRKVAAS
ncbi:MAG: hypothetical protein K0S07_1182 [Chlamydiales bacterium]|jgi:predicted  nucleic acid-binding Zn-ribbon protein|nr:hypothetical protein [Chlamydiales bacterium]